MSILDGLPSLPSNFPAFTAGISILTEDLVSPPQSNEWGIFLNGEAVVLADNVLSLEFKQEYLVSDYPLEGGSFASYNKVQRPAEAKVRFSAGGSQSTRTAFLQSIQSIIGDLNLYDIVSPEVVYVNFNLTHQDYKRTAESGVGLISLDVWCREIRPASSSLTNTTTNAGSSPQNLTPSGPSGTSSSDVGPLTGQDRINGGFAAINEPQSPTAQPVTNDGNVVPSVSTTAQQSIITNYNFAVQ